MAAVASHGYISTKPDFVAAAASAASGWLFRRRWRVSSRKQRCPKSGSGYDEARCKLPAWPRRDCKTDLGGLQTEKRGKERDMRLPGFGSERAEKPAFDYRRLDVPQQTRAALLALNRAKQNLLYLPDNLWGWWKRRGRRAGRLKMLSLVGNEHGASRTASLSSASELMVNNGWRNEAWDVMELLHREGFDQRRTAAEQAVADKTNELEIWHICASNKPTPAGRFLQISGQF